MNIRLGAFVLGAVAGWCGAACRPPAAEQGGGGGGLSDVGSGSGGDDGPGGSGGGDVGGAIDEQKARLTALDADLAAARDKLETTAHDPRLVEAVVALQHDQVAGASFLAHLERCVVEAEQCPSSLDEPTIPSEWDATLGELKGAFAADVDAWPAAAAAIAGASCACRTRDCVNWVIADLRRWEDALSLSDQDAGDAAVHVTAARACVWSRLGL